jgi:CheY-like chemotaxis protein
MDVSMPVLDGIAATKEIRKAGLMQIPIIALAANTIKSDMDQFLVQGMNDFVSRPVRRASRCPAKMVEVRRVGVHISFRKRTGCLPIWGSLYTESSREEALPRRKEYTG